MFTEELKLSIERYSPLYGGGYVYSEILLTVNGAQLEIIERALSEAALNSNSFLSVVQYVDLHQQLETAFSKQCKLIERTEL